MRRLFTMRHLIWFLMSVATLIALLIAAGNWTGARRWAEAQARLRGEGETLDFQALLPPDTDQGRNFCAIPPLRDISLPGDEKSPQGIRRKALEKLAEEKTPDKPQGKDKLKSPVKIVGGPALGQSMNVKGWGVYARQMKIIDSATDAPRDVFAAFDQAQPLAKELAEAAARYPEAAFEPSLRERALPRLLYGLAVPHYAGIQNATRALRLRSALALESGDSAAAAQSAKAIMRFCEALLRDPLMISYLVALSTHNTGEEAVWSLLEKRTATEVDLIGLQASLMRLDFAQSELKAMRGELAMGIQAIDYLRESPAALDAQGPSGQESKPTLGFLRHLIPAGFYDHNKATLAQLYATYFIEPLKTGDTAVLRAKAAEFSGELKTHRSPLDVSYTFAQKALPALLPVLDRGTVAKMLRRQAILACALERYFIQNRAYPTTLTELVPTFLPSVPDDPMDNRAMRYRRTPAGRYALWSVGFDGKDDGGTVKFPPNGRLAIGEIHKDGYKGDWVWQYEEARP